MSVYLIHFSAPYHHARHYLGSADDVHARLELHRGGHGARLTQVVIAAGIELQLVRTWQGGRREERLLKDQDEAPKLCPVCNPNAFRFGDSLICPDCRRIRRLHLRPDGRCEYHAQGVQA